MHDLPPGKNVAASIPAPRTGWNHNRDELPASPSKRQNRNEQQAHARLGEQGPKRWRWERRLIEIHRQRREVGGVGDAVVIEVALCPELSRSAAKVARQRIEVQRINLA